MLKKTAQGLMVLAALLWSTSGVEARDLLKNAQFDVYGLFGGSTILDARYFDSSGRLYHTRYEPDYKFSIGVAVPYNRFLTIESGFTYGPDNLVLTNTNIFPHTVASGSVVVYPVNVYLGTLSAVVHAPIAPRHFQPFVEGGVEYDRFSPTTAAINTALTQGWASTSTALINHNDKFGFNVGGGLDRKLTKRLTFRIDVRDHVTSSPAFGLPNSYSDARFPIQGRCNNLIYEAGFLYHLGKR
jgi:opacity protein-like surface antigen